MGFFDTFLYPFKIAIAWLWIVSHDALVALGTNESWGWVGGILVMTIIVRIIVLPLALKSARSARAMGVIQPEIKKIQDKYKDRRDPESRRQMQLEISDLYGHYGANPMASCWPMLVQMPVLFALYRVLYNAPAIAHGTWAKSSLGPMTQSVAQNIENSTFFGAQLSDSMLTTSDPHTRYLAIILVVVYVALMWLSMGWLAPKNMGTGNDQAARMMKIMGITMPIMMAFVGFNLQIGVLVYWMVSMLFSLIQQWGILYFLPTPNSPAHKNMLARHQRRYDSYKETREGEYTKKIEQLGFSDLAVSEAQVKLGRAERKSETALAETKSELGENMVKAVSEREALQTDLRDKRIKLELEAAPRKQRDPNKKSFMQKMLEVQDKAEARQAGRADVTPGQRDHTKQPRNLTRAQQKEARERRAQAQAKKNYDKEEIERKRAERKKAARERAKKKRQQK